MVRRLEVKDARVSQNELFLQAQVDTKEDLPKLVDGERLLVDTENLAFIYLLESQNEYTHLSIETAMWPMLKEAIDGNFMVKLHVENQVIVLKAMIQELLLLLENMKGNSNYGDEIVEKVEEIF